MPSNNDPRDGWVDLALIPGHVRYWRDNPGAPAKSEPIDESPEPFLRFGVNEETVILTRKHVEQIQESLSWWLKATSNGTD